MSTDGRQAGTQVPVSCLGINGQHFHLKTCTGFEGGPCTYKRIERNKRRATGFNKNRMLSDELTDLRNLHPTLEFADRTAYTAAAKVLHAAGFSDEAKLLEAKAQSGIAAKLEVSKQLQPKKFVATIESLEAIANAPERESISGTRTQSTESRKPSEYIEDQIQTAANEWAEKQGVFVLPIDQDGLPDNQYSIGGRILGYVEWKRPGNRPERHQAVEILKMIKAGHDVQVFSDIEDFKLWLGNKLGAA